MKKLIFASIFTAITSLVGCSDQETPSSTVENLFSAVEEGDAAGAAMYLTPEAAFWLPMMIAAAQEPGQAEIIKEAVAKTECNT